MMQLFEMYVFFASLYICYCRWERNWQDFEKSFGTAMHINLLHIFKRTVIENIYIISFGNPGYFDVKFDFEHIQSICPLTLMTRLDTDRM